MADVTVDGRVPIKRALVSVYDKTGLEDLVRGLHDAGVALVSTGGSAKLIEGLGLPVTKVEDLTGFPECLDGRVKTLHPRVHAGILADRRLDAHVRAARRARRRAVRPGRLQPLPVHRRPSPRAPARTTCVEQIDIGGPSMVRAAAKNHAVGRHRHLPERYADVLAAAADGGFTLAQRQTLAAEAFVHTATYDVAVASWIGNVLTDTSEGDRLPGLRPARPGRRRRCCATARTRTSPPRSTPAATARRGLAAGRAAARQGDVVQQLRRHRRRAPRRQRLRRARGRDHQARQPLRHRGRRGRRRGPPPARTPATRSPPSAA